MNLTSKKLKQLIREELRKFSLEETRDDHIDGIRAKIERLEAEKERQEGSLNKARDTAAQMQDFYSDDPYAGRDEMDNAWGTMQTVSGIEDKLENLYAQLKSFEEAEGGYVGELPRPN